MANVSQAIEFCLRQEDRTLTGKIVNLNDGAGLTRFGITSKNHPELVASGFFKDMPRDRALDTAKICYTGEYAKPLRIAELHYQPLANAVLSLGIHSSNGVAASMLQQAILSHQIHVDVDGDLGPITVSAANMLIGELLLFTFTEMAKKRYKELVERTPRNMQFYRGWINRANEWLSA